MYITEETSCPVCKGTDLSEDYSSIIIVLDPENSQLAKEVGIEQPGKYALKIR
jgi:DNA-directed RNA polymerase subunit E"